MRIKHTLLKVSNGWILLPEGHETVDTSHAGEYVVFKSLKEFSEWKPKQVRRKRSKEKPLTVQLTPTGKPIGKL